MSEEVDNEDRPDAHAFAPEGKAPALADEASSGSNEESSFKVFDRRFWQQDKDMSEEGEGRSEVPSYVQSLQDQLAEKDKQLREYIAAYKQEVVEELEQTKDRIQRDADQQMKQLRGELATPMIEVLEVLERSLNAAQSNPDSTSLIDGVELVRKLMVNKLKDFGLERIESIGQPFDPTVHEAIAVAPVDAPDQDNIVVSEYSPGFCHDGQVVRAAKVQVGRLQS